MSRRYLLVAEPSSSRSARVGYAITLLEPPVMIRSLEDRLPDKPAPHRHIQKKTLATLDPYGISAIFEAMVRTIGDLLFYILFGYCSISVLYLFILSFCGKFFYKSVKNQPAGCLPSRRIAIIVPAYKEDNVILSTAQNLLQLDYPRELFDVFIMADSFQPSTLKALAGLPIFVHQVTFVRSTVTKSLNAAFGVIDGVYDIALINDGDNIPAKDFLRLTNEAFINGARAMQGRRVAKNLDTSFAVLDACSEAVNNNIFRRGSNALGLSSPVSGSGMAFEFGLIKQLLGEIDAVGFDKVLQLKLLEQHIFIYFLHDAVIYDEKVDSPHAFRQQRKRWISTQFVYLREFFFPAFRQLFKGNFSYFNLVFSNYFILPKGFLFVILPFLVLASFALRGVWSLAAFAVWLIFLTSIALALPRSLVNKELGKAVLSLPKAIFFMFGALFQMKKAEQTFIHTPHTKTHVSNPQQGKR